MSVVGSTIRLKICVFQATADFSLHWRASARLPGSALAPFRGETLSEWFMSSSSIE